MIAAVAGLLAQDAQETRASFDWVAHTQKVIRLTAEPVDHVRRAESNLRGYAVSRDPSFIEELESSLQTVRPNLDQLVTLTQDNPEQNARARSLRQAVLTRLTYLEQGASLVSQNGVKRSLSRVGAGAGRVVLVRSDQLRNEMLRAEEGLLTQRTHRAGNLLVRTQWLLTAGGLTVAGLVLLMILVVVRSIQRPTRMMLEAMAELGAGDTTTRVDVARIGSREFRRLAYGYNGMADRLDRAIDRLKHSDEELQTINLELQTRSDAMHARSEVIELLSDMAHRLQAARREDEVDAVIGCFVPRVLPATAGTVYAHNNSRNQLVRIASWGDMAGSTESFVPEDCWGLRLGQSHSIDGPGHDVPCAHAASTAGAYHCEPLLAGGEVIGLIHMRGKIEPERRYRLDALAENIASALVNHCLQQHLREQTIRDPLTGLFNRRYLEECLTLEIARAARSHSPLSVVMCDVDHFKRFNDEFGHDGGDAVLQAISAEMLSHFRDGDIVCRLGGEEFAIVAPGATPEAIAPRIEKLRMAITNLQVRKGQQALGSVSMSFGVSRWEEHLHDGSSLLALADEALYQAKRSGRNKLVIADRWAA